MITQTPRTRTLGNGHHANEDDDIGYVYDNSMELMGKEQKPTFSDTQAVIALAKYFEHIGRPICFEASAADSKKGKWRYWTSTHWAIYPASELEQDIYWLLGGKILSRKLSDLTDSLKKAVGKSQHHFDKTDKAVFKDCVLAIRDNKVKIEADGHRKEDWGTFEIPINLKGCEQIKTPRWDAFLEQALPDKDDQACLQEILGYILFPTCRKQVFFVFSGEPGTGKGTLCRFLQELLGKERCTSIKMSQINEDIHATADLVDSVLNIDPECEGVIDRNGSGAAESVLKSISGDDTIRVRPLYQPGYNVLLNCRMLLVSNTPPRFRDQTDALWQRMVILPFDHRPAAQTDEYYKCFVPEAAGILHWSLKGLMRMLAKQTTRSQAFTQSARAIEQKTDLRMDSDPFKQWAEERIEAKENAAIEKQTAFIDYHTWCINHGYKPTGDARFGQRMKSLGYPTTKPHRGGRCFIGVSLRS